MIEKCTRFDPKERPLFSSFIQSSKRNTKQFKLKDTGSITPNEQADYTQSPGAVQSDEPKVDPSKPPTPNTESPEVPNTGEPVVSPQPIEPVVSTEPTVEIQSSWSDIVSNLEVKYMLYM